MACVGHYGEGYGYAGQQPGLCPLASPNRIGDTSWIKTGKVAWDWWNDWNLKGVPFKAGINMDTYKYYIDFASRNGLSLLCWMKDGMDPKSGDMLTVIPELDLPELIAYGKSKGGNSALDGV